MSRPITAAAGDDIKATLHPDMYRTRRYGAPNSEASSAPRYNPLVRHPDIPDILEGEVLSLDQPADPEVVDRDLDDLYEVAPGYLEVEGVEDTPPSSLRKGRDRSLSLPNGNFRLLRSRFMNIKRYNAGHECMKYECMCTLCK